MAAIIALITLLGAVVVMILRLIMAVLAKHLQGTQGVMLPIASAGAPRLSRYTSLRAEPHKLLYRDLEAESGLFERLATARSVSRELVLTTSDLVQLPMTLNLLSNLDELGIRHYLLLARTRQVCMALRPRAGLPCSWSSYLLNRRSRSGKPPRASPVEKMWLQRHHYLGRAIGAGLNVLLLDSDVLLSRSPYPYLHGAFGRFTAVVLSDSTASADPLHANGGVWYVHNASRRGPIRAIFEAFDAAVAQAIDHGSSKAGALFDQQVPLLLASSHIS